MRSLARLCYSRRKLVLVTWLLVLVGLWIITGAVKGKYRTDFKLPGSESQAALDLLQSRGAADRSGISTQIVFKADQGVNDPAVKSRMEQFFSDVESSVDNVSISSPYDSANAFQVSADGNIAYAQLNLGDRPQEQYVNDADDIKELWKQIDVPGLEVELGGDIFAEFSQPPSEALGVVAAVIILLIAFGSLLAMGLPIVTALFGVGCGAAIIQMLTGVLAVPEFTPLIAALIGIGVGIDYSLLIVTRYRQGLHDGLEPGDAVALAIDTSGRAVLFAGMTVVISLLGLFLMNLDFMRSLALGAMSAVLMTMAASLTLLPSFLGFVGHNIDRFGLPHRASESEADIARSFWFKWSRVIQKHPWPALLLSVALLVSLAVPVFFMRFGFSDAGNRLPSDTTRRAYDLLGEAFGPGFNGPVVLLVDGQAGPSDDATIEKLTSEVAATAGVAKMGPAQKLGDTGLILINAFPTTSPQDKETTELVHRLRDNTIPRVAQETGAKVYVDGLPAAVVDFSDYTSARLPWFVGAVLLLSFMLLLTVFHSVVVPLKAVIMNLLSIGAAFGATIIVFQWGVGESLLGVGKAGPIEAWGPMFIFAIVFGLSMDYEVFLLTRVREEYDRNGGDNGRAVADGLAATGRVISAAALIMVCVFGAFILGDDRSVKMVGFALSFAIFIDATVVRLILVPSAMELLGRANWWAPAWLVRRLPTIRVDAEAAPQPLGGGGGGS
jgi:putative drug exporter of the RND superfamily